VDLALAFDDIDRHAIRNRGHYAEEIERHPAGDLVEPGLPAAAAVRLELRKFLSRLAAALAGHLVTAHLIERGAELIDVDPAADLAPARGIGDKHSVPFRLPGPGDATGSVSRPLAAGLGLPPSRRSTRPAADPGVNASMRHRGGPIGMTEILLQPRHMVFDAVPVNELFHSAADVPAGLCRVLERAPFAL